MLGKLVGDLRENRLLAGMDGTDCVQQFLMQEIFQQVSPSASLEGAQNLNVARVGGQYDDSCLRKFVANSNQRIEAVHFRHLQQQRHLRIGEDPFIRQQLFKPSDFDLCFVSFQNLGLASKLFRLRLPISLSELPIATVMMTCTSSGNSRS